MWVILRGLNFFSQFLRPIRNPVPFLSKFNFASIRESLLARFDRWTFQFRLRATNLAMPNDALSLTATEVWEECLTGWSTPKRSLSDKRSRFRSKSAPDRKTDGRPRKVIKEPCFVALRVMEIAKLCNTRDWRRPTGEEQVTKCPCLPAIYGESHVKRESESARWNFYSARNAVH